MSICKLCIALKHFGARTLHLRRLPTNEAIGSALSQKPQLAIVDNADQKTGFGSTLLHCGAYLNVSLHGTISNSNDKMFMQVAQLRWMQVSLVLFCKLQNEKITRFGRLRICCAYVCKVRRRCVYLLWLFSIFYLPTCFCELE